MISLLQMKDGEKQSGFCSLQCLGFWMLLLGVKPRFLQMCTDGLDAANMNSESYSPNLTALGFLSGMGPAFDSRNIFGELSPPHQTHSARKPHLSKITQDQCTVP